MFQEKGKCKRVVSKGWCKESKPLFTSVAWYFGVQLMISFTSDYETVEQRQGGTSVGTLFVVCY